MSTFKSKTKLYSFLGIFVTGPFRVEKGQRWGMSKEDGNSG